MNRRFLATVASAFVVWFIPTLLNAQQVDVNDANEKAIKDAIAKVAPSVVRIETAGGADMIVWVDPATRQPIRKVIGPTTGLVIDSDGYIITSSFNFSNKPTDIFVTIPGKGRSVAKVVANDLSRMLTLLKTDLTGLTVPTAVPSKEIEIGQWSIALGRALDANIDRFPSVSTGIVSALGRVWGKAIQTDAKVSPNNYGGPLISIDGRVQGILVPASPNGEGDNAGIEWYDSGIGFAIPLEDVLKVLPKMKEGKPDKQVTLRPGLLGITPKSADQFSVEPVIGTVAPDSSADRIGLRPNDLILEIDGTSVHNYAQILHILKPKYEGDAVSIKIRRGKQERSFEKVVLAGTATAFETGFFGILPMRDDPDAGVEIRYVYPNSPAEELGLKPGDRIMKVGPAQTKQMQPFHGRNQFAQLMNNFPVKMEVSFEVKRKDGIKVETLTTRLTNLPDLVPPEKDYPLPDEASKLKALVAPKPLEPIGQPKTDPKPKFPKKDEDKKSDEKKEDEKKEERKVEVGFLKRENAAQGRKYWIYVPRNYNANRSYGLVIWLHPADVQGRDADDVTDIWAPYLSEFNMIMVGPISKAKEGWSPSELDGILSDVQDITSQYTIDRNRVIAHGTGIGGQMAFYLGFNAREVIRGVATHAAVLATQPKDTVPQQRLQFFIVAGEKDPIVKDIEKSKPKLSEKKYSVIYREIKNLGKQYIDAEADEGTLKEMLRWMDSLDRQ